MQFGSEMKIYGDKSVFEEIKGRLAILELGVSIKEPHLRRVSDKLVRREGSYLLRVSRRIDMFVMNELEEILGLSRDAVSKLEEEDFNLFDYLDELESNATGSLLLKNSKRDNLKEKLRLIRGKTLLEYKYLYENGKIDWTQMDCLSFVNKLSSLKTREEKVLEEFKQQYIL